MHILFKLEDESYRRALERAIYFLNYTDIKFYFWDKNIDYTTIGHQHIILLEDRLSEIELNMFPYRHRIFGSQAEINTMPALHKEMTLSELVLVIKDYYKGEAKLGQITTQLHLVTGNHGGVGKSIFAQAASRCCSMKVCVVELFETHSSLGSPLTELVWQWHASRYQESQAHMMATSESYETPVINGFCCQEELREMDADWVYSALRDYGVKNGISKLWIVLPSLLLNASKELVSHADVHWHLVDSTRSDNTQTLAYWHKHRLILQNSKIVYTETRPNRILEGDVDIPYDSSPSLSRVKHCVETLLRREGVLAN